MLKLANLAAFAGFLAALATTPTISKAQDNENIYQATLTAKPNTVTYLKDHPPGWFGERGNYVHDTDPRIVLDYWITGSVNYRGKTYARSIRTENAPGFQYQIDGFDYFDATCVGLMGKNHFGEIPRVIYSVYGDNKLLYSTQPLPPDHAPVDIHVRVTGVYKLWLETRISEPVISKIWWGDARLSKAKAPAPHPEPQQKEHFPAQPRPTGGLSPQPDVLEIAAAVGTLSLEQLEQLDAMIHRRLQTLRNANGNAR